MAGCGTCGNKSRNLYSEQKADSAEDQAVLDQMRAFVNEVQGVAAKYGLTFDQTRDSLNQFMSQLGNQKVQAPSN